MHIIMNNMTLHIQVANFCRSSGFLGVVSFYCFEEKFACSTRFPENVSPRSLRNTFRYVPTNADNSL